MGRKLIYIYLIIINLFYSLVSIATKYTSQQEPLSFSFFYGLFIVVCILGLYAILWQMILKRVDLTIAYSFKGTSLIFVMLFSYLFFLEGISIQNIIGAIFIISGIVLFSKE